MEHLIAQIDAFLAEHGMSDSRFGQLALNDRHFVRQLRDKRDVRMSTVDKVQQFMAAYQPEQDAAA
jgi:hypothetical protein